MFFAQNKKPHQIRNFIRHYDNCDFWDVTWCSLHVRVQITELSVALILQKQENDILKTAAAYFARTLLDKPPSIWRHITEGRKII
jgi:hypothetical protein